MPAGRPRKPTAKKVLEGTFRNTRANKKEAKPKVGLPEPPAFLTADAKKLWKALGPKLVRLGLITEIDEQAFAAYCDAWAEFCLACAELEKYGYTFETENGYACVHPMVGVKNKAAEKMKKFGSLFGLSPADRAKVEAAVDDPDQSAEVFLFGGKK